MSGKGNIRFSDLFADTVGAFGIVWARAHYLKNGMSPQEFNLWCAVYYRQPVLAL